MSVPAAWPQVLDFFGTSLVIDPSPGQLGGVAVGEQPGLTVAGGVVAAAAGQAQARGGQEEAADEAVAGALALRACVGLSGSPDRGAACPSCSAGRPARQARSPGPASR